MLDALRSTAAPAPLPPVATARTSLSLPVMTVDRVTLAGPLPNLAQKLAPIIDQVAQAGYPEVAARLRKARFQVTDGKAFGMEYYAAAYPLTGTVALHPRLFETLEPKEIASILLHEGIHLKQGMLKKALGNVTSVGGRFLKYNSAEKEAYLAQWQAMTKLGITSGEIYYATRYALEEMGVLPPEA